MYELKVLKDTKNGCQCSVQTSHGKCKNRARYTIAHQNICLYHFDKIVVSEGNCYCSNTRVKSIYETHEKLENTYLKLKEAQKCSSRLLKELKEYPEKVQELMLASCNLDGLIEPQAFYEYSDLTPIEQIFVVAFNYLCSVDQGEAGQLFWLEEQYEIVVRNKRYIVDFLFDSTAPENARVVTDRDYKNKDVKLAIECDGFDYHSTKTQMEKDNERELDLKMAGFDVIRFSGSQIVKDPLKCAMETYEYIIKLLKE
jgi:very-short-patch-repair endonuclease